MVHDSVETVVVKPPLQTLEHWVGVILVPSLVAGPIVWCYLVTAASQRGWSWVIVPAVLWLLGVGLMVFVSIGFYGARANGKGLVLEKAWQPASSTHVAWDDIVGLRIEITPEKRRRVRYDTRLQVLEDGEEVTVECPYGADLCRAIVSRAGLQLRRGPDGWRTTAGGAGDPFLAIKELSGEEQSWRWVRREPSSE